MARDDVFAAHPLRRRPQYLASWLATRNRLRRSPLPWLGGLLTVGLIVWGVTRPALRLFLERCNDFPVLLVLFIAVLVALGVARHRHTLGEHARSWLAALPFGPGTFESVILGPVTSLLVVLVLLVAAGAAGLPWRLSAHLLALYAGGTALGVAVGWWLPHGEAEAQPGSWYATVHQVRGGGFRASLLPLGYWPVARSRGLARPRITAFAALLVLLGVPLGTSGTRVLAILAGVLIGWHLATLQAGALRVAFAAARWLTPTPMRLARFTASLLYLSWLKQAVTCALVLAAAAVLAPRVVAPRGIELALAWLGFCVAGGLLACTAALGSRGALRLSLHRWLR